jgi:hypothetical protein
MRLVAIEDTMHLTKLLGWLVSWLDHFIPRTSRMPYQKTRKSISSVKLDVSNTDKMSDFMS